MGDVLLGQHPQQTFRALARAAALRAHGARLEDSHALLVEEPQQQFFGREHRVKQLVVLDRLGKQPRAVPVLVRFPAQSVVMALALAERAQLGCRRVLDHYATRPPGLLAGPAVGADRVVARNRHAQ